MSNCTHRIRELSATADFVECLACGRRFDLQTIFAELGDSDDALTEAEAKVERLNDEVRYLEWLCRGLTIHEGNNRNAFEQYKDRRESDE